ncbi:MAG: chromosomal replication initiator protein DnaA [Planctomycetota bacterium]|jgi:chromosomal replication initiator protein
MQSVITDDRSRAAGSQVSLINETIAEKVGAQKFRIWFKNSTRLTLSDGYLRVGVPNLFIASWIENHFANEISEAVREATGGNQKITFAIDPELSGHQRRTQLDSQAQLVSKSRERHRGRGGKIQPGAKRKLKLSLDTFVVGTSNELAYNAAKAIVEEERPQTNWLYLSAEDFVNQFVLALKTKKLEAFRRRMRQTDLLAIDDIHFLASKPSTQEEFLHTFNTIDLAGKQVVMVSDAHPKMIGQLSEKLVSRFVSGMVVKINTPSLQTRCRICKQYAGSMKKHVPESVIRYIAENLRSNVREMQGALLKLIAFASLQNQKINLYMAKEVLSEHLARTDPIVHISDIESAVATYFGITPANIHSSKKDRTVSLARHFSMYLARKHTKMSSSEIGRFMGNKNHATVLLACKKITDQIKQNVELRWHGPAGNKISKARTVLAHLEESVSG